MFPAADQLDYASPRFLNPDFARITNNKNIPKSKHSATTFADLEKVEPCARTLVAGQSQSYWLLSALLYQLKQDGFRPSDPALFDKNISALSASFETQTSVCAGLSDFVTAKRRESFLAHASFLVSELQKRELLVSPGSDLLFNQPLLEKISSQLKEDSLVSSSLSLSGLLCFSGLSKSSQPASQRYSSPLEYLRPGTSTKTSPHFLRLLRPRRQFVRGLSDFVTAKRRESFLAHASFPVSEPQKWELLVSPVSDLFNQPLLEKISSQLKEDFSLLFSVLVQVVAFLRPI